MKSNFKTTSVVYFIGLNFFVLEKFTHQRVQVLYTLIAGYSSCLWHHVKNVCEYSARLLVIRR